MRVTRIKMKNICASNFRTFIRSRIYVPQKLWSEKIGWCWEALAGTIGGFVERRFSSEWNRFLGNVKTIENIHQTLNPMLQSLVTHPWPDISFFLFPCWVLVTTFMKREKVKERKNVGLKLPEMFMKTKRWNKNQQPCDVFAWQA